MLHTVALDIILYLGINIQYPSKKHDIGYIYYPANPLPVEIPLRLHFWDNIKIKTQTEESKTRSGKGVYQRQKLEKEMNV